MPSRSVSSRFRRLLYHAGLVCSGRRDHIGLLTHMRQRQFEPFSAMEAARDRRLKAMLGWCQDRVPFYRRAMEEASLTRQDVEERPLLSLACLPVVTRRMLRERGPEFHATGLSSGAWYENSSSGSTGEPLRFRQDHHHLNSCSALKELFDEWTGYEVGAPRVSLWGEADRLGGAALLRRGIARLLRNETVLSTSSLGRPDYRRYVEIINRRRPRQILAYAEAIDEMARVVQQDGLEVHTPSAIMTTAGTLTEAMRRTIEEAFRCSVFNRYGTREFGAIACQCEQGGGMHVNPELHVVEVLSDDDRPLPPGRPGRIVVSLLTTRAQPLLRYDTGDVGSLADGLCPCGRPWPRLAAVDGRVNELITTSRGTFMSFVICGIIRPVRALHQYQFIQRTPTDYLLRTVVADPSRWDVEWRELQAKLRALLGDDVVLREERVDHIPPAPSGKRNFVRSEVRGPAVDAIVSGDDLDF